MKAQFIRGGNTFKSLNIGKERIQYFKIGDYVYIKPDADKSTDDYYDWIGIPADDEWIKNIKKMIKSKKSFKIMGLYKAEDKQFVDLDDDNYTTLDINLITFDKPLQENLEFYRSKKKYKFLNIGKKRIQYFKIDDYVYIKDNALKIEVKKRGSISNKSWEKSMKELIKSKESFKIINMGEDFKNSITLKIPNVSYTLTLEKDLITK